MTFRFLVLTLALVPAALAQSGPHHLTAGESELRYEPAARPQLTARTGQFQLAPSRLWELVLHRPGKPWLQHEPIRISAATQEIAATVVDRELRLATPALKTPAGTLPIAVELRLALQDGDIVGSLRVNNGTTDWVVRDLVFTAFNGAKGNPETDYALLWPNGLGQRFTSPTDFGQRSLPYPSGRGTMSWIAFAGPRDGLYLGAHDAARGAKDFSVRWTQRATLEADIVHTLFCAPGASAVTAPVVVRGYTGTWHAAARIYRDWFHSAIALAPQPGWLKTHHGWLLAVLKQQNGDVLWDYREIDKLCDLADAHGLDIIGFFGWAHGGHDKFFPEFAPDPLMGGPAALKAALARAKARGKKTILYANGIMMDVTTGFYAQQGNEVAKLRENQELELVSVRKFMSAPPVSFAMACPAADAWREQMWRLAEQAQRLGASGILFDQLGTGGAGLCFAPHHCHGRFGAAVGPDRFPLVAEITARMRTIDPEFVIATEGMTDGLFESVGYFHGWGTGFTAPRDASNEAPDMFSRGNDFPQLLRYTFPDWPGTIRHATPGIDAYHANHAVLLGLGLEIEGRYRADKRYLEQGIVPTASDYDDVTYYPPDYRLLASLPPARAVEIARRAADLRRRNAEWLERGRFRDVEGIEFSGDGVAAAVFESAARTHVVVLVNRTGGPRAFTLRTSWGTPVRAENFDAANVAPLDPLAPHECRVLHFAGATRTTAGE